MQILHIISFERDSAEQEGKQDHTCAPQVSLESLVALVSDDLWGNVCRRSTLLEHKFALFDGLGDAEVSDLDVALSIKQNVVQFDISVQDLL